MKKGIIAGLLLLTGSISAQVTNTDSLTNEPLNSVQNIIAGNGAKRVTLGTYAQIDYNQQIADTVRHNGKMDIHRLVMFLGYRFTSKTTFVSEIEIEHVKEVYVEQAFLNHNINNWLNFRAGLLLIPMGIINEYHEPTTFNGVERPNLEKYIVPTTWREMGVGFAGKFDNLSLKYQAYVVNGFMGYRGSGAVFNGNKGFRSGRQKAAESSFTFPNFSTKWDYYGIPGLKIGLAGYFGKSQTSAYDGLKSSDNDAVASADSTVVGISMVGLDFRYMKSGFQARGEIIYSDIKNTRAYNTYTGSDLGSSMMGYYLEAGYDIIRLFNKDAEKKLNLFVRYENYNTHNTVYDELIMNDAYNRTDITVGMGLDLAYGARLKADYQMFTNADNNTDAKHQVNLGVGIWF